MSVFITDLPQRFQRHIRVTSGGCWLWMAYCDKDGYAQSRVGSRTDGTYRNVRTARYLYQQFVRAIPDGLQVDHLCRQRACVNTNHLEPVTPRENTLRGKGVTAVNHRKQRCKRGHDFTEDNTYWWNNMRHCRRCKSERSRRYREAKECHAEQ